MSQRIEEAFALIGRYIVMSIVVAVVLAVRADAVPFWCAFPLTTVWMIANGTMRPGNTHRKHR